MKATRTITSRKFIWENQQDYGCELLKLTSSEDGVTAKGTVINQGNQGSYVITYQIDLDRHWSTKRLHIVHDEGGSLEIFSDGKGKWFNQSNEELDELMGAMDVDVSITPFTNTLPINRLNWEINQSRDFEMVYISLPSLHMQKVTQSYTFVNQKDDVRIFRYQSRGFEAYVSVDEEGIVKDYPGLFVRR